jgi:hypothetical protein
MVRPVCIAMFPRYPGVAERSATRGGVSVSPRLNTQSMNCR